MACATFKHTGLAIAVVAALSAIPAARAQSAAATPTAQDEDRDPDQEHGHDPHRDDHAERVVRAPGADADKARAIVVTS